METSASFLNVYQFSTYTKAIRVSRADGLSALFCRIGRLHGRSPNCEAVRALHSVPEEAETMVRVRECLVTSILPWLSKDTPGRLV